MPPAAMTIGGLRRLLAEQLRAAFAASGRTGTPDLDARLLLAEAAGLDEASLLARENAAVDAPVAARALGLVQRRAGGEPVARILGHKEFWGLDLTLSPATLVPRPDTETLVEAALTFVKARLSAPRILDLGAGSGAILLALLSEMPEATGVGTDISFEAALTARANAVRLGLTARAAFVVGNWMDMIGARFDIVAANPPYVPEGEIDALAVEVREHDPRRALAGGADGLAAYRAIFADLARVLSPAGAAFLEIGAGQREAVVAIAYHAGFTPSFVGDIAGIDRVAVVRSSGS